MSDERRLKVTFRRVQSERAGAARVLTVFCPRLSQVVDLRQCQECPHCQGLCIDPTDRDDFVRCTWDGTGSHESLPGGAASSPGPRDASLSSVMSAPAHCVRPDLPLSELIQLFIEEGISGAPVVDGAGRPVGIVSKSDVLRHGSSDDARIGHVAGAEVASIGAGAAALAVRDVMTHVVFTLQAEASLSRAAALMAYEGVHRIVVVAADGSALGIVSSLDILRWMARQDGYVVPTPSRRSPPRPEQAS